MKSIAEEPFGKIAMRRWVYQPEPCEEFLLGTSKPSLLVNHYVVEGDIKL